MSAWNDNGKAGLINETAPELLYRTDFFGGLGWMLTKWDNDDCVCSILLLKLQGTLVRADGEMAAELLGRLDARTRAKKRFQNQYKILF